MRKPYVRLMLLAAIGAALAVLVMWAGGPDIAKTSSNPVGRPSAAALDVGTPPSLDGSPARARSDTEPLTPAMPGVPGDVSEPASLAAFGSLAASAVEANLNLGADRDTGAEPVTHADDQGDDRPTSDAERPLGWCFRTTLNSDFASDSSTVWNGSRSVLLRRHEGVEPDYHVSILWQGIDAAPYRGSRIEVSAQVQSAGGVALLLQTATRELSLANEFRVASSNNKYFSVPTQGWTRLSIVGDIPLDADVMFYGVAHSGRASLWVDDVRVAKVGPDSAVTVTASQNAWILLPPVEPGSILAAPFNLDFEVTNGVGESGARTGSSC